ncbi:hypothetical protein AMST5_00979 [freshwater sediment metagenome]|uniref:Uncharacterized protein n=1 Tax=freshwater sediment metagenome TaxID=556182 RepID=A0AA48M027_9ZZZZ
MPRHTPPKRGTTAKPTHTSAVTNRTRFLTGVDSRTLWARRYRDIVYAIAEDCGGIDHMSEAKLAIAKRVATISVELEAQESALATGDHEGFDLLKFCQAANALRRMLEALGLEKVSAKDVSPTPSIHDLVARHKNDPAFIDATAEQEREDVLLEEGFDSREEDSNPAHVQDSPDQERPSLAADSLATAERIP